MTAAPGRLKSAIIFGSIAVLPLLVLEWMNQPVSFRDFPYLLFLVLWAIPSLFWLALSAVAHSLKAERWFPPSLGFWLSLFIALILAWAWISILSDQMPCFLGIPNCD